MEKRTNCNDQRCKASDTLQLYQRLPVVMSMCSTQLGTDLFFPTIGHRCYDDGTRTENLPISAALCSQMKPWQKYETLL
jgi:hypothetical protein